MTWVARLGLGGFFLYSGLAKALHPVEFLKLLRLYDFTDASVVLNVIAATLPWFEVVCGAALVFGIAVRGTALVTLALLVPFTGVVLRRALALQAAQAIPFCAVRFDCGCGMGEVAICYKLVENALLIGAALWLLASFPQRLRWQGRAGGS